MHAWFLRLALVSLVAGCAEPQSSDYYGGSRTRDIEGLSLGVNASGESCNQLPGDAAGSVVVYCGTWQQPAARVSVGPASDASSPMSVATSGAWREAIDLRFVCDAPVATSVLGGAPAAML